MNLQLFERLHDSYLLTGDRKYLDSMRRVAQSGLVLPITGQVLADPDNLALAREFSDGIAAYSSGPIEANKWEKPIGATPDEACGWQNPLLSEVLQQLQRHPTLSTAKELMQDLLAGLGDFSYCYLLPKWKASDTSAESLALLPVALAGRAYLLATSKGCFVDRQIGIRPQPCDIAGDGYDLADAKRRLDEALDAPELKEQLRKDLAAVTALLAEFLAESKRRFELRTSGKILEARGRDLNALASQTLARLRALERTQAIRSDKSLLNRVVLGESDSGQQARAQHTEQARLERAEQARAELAKAEDINQARAEQEQAMLSAARYELSGVFLDRRPGEHKRLQDALQRLIDTFPDGEVRSRLIDLLRRVRARNWLGLQRWLEPRAPDLIDELLMARPRTWQDLFHLHERVLIPLASARPDWRLNWVGNKEASLQDFNVDQAEFRRRLDASKDKNLAELIELVEQSGADLATQRALRNAGLASTSAPSFQHLLHSLEKFSALEYIAQHWDEAAELRQHIAKQPVVMDRSPSY